MTEKNLERLSLTVGEEYYVDIVDCFYTYRCISIYDRQYWYRTTHLSYIALLMSGHDNKCRLRDCCSTKSK